MADKLRERPDPDANALYDKYAGQIVFSRSAIDRKQSDSSGFVTSVELGDPLFLRYYAAKPPLAYLAGDGSQGQCVRGGAGVTASLEGGTGDAGLDNYEFEGDNFVFTRSASAGHKLPLFPQGPVDFTSAPKAQIQMLSLFTQLKPGANVIDVEVSYYCMVFSKATPGAHKPVNAKIATGKLTLNVSAAQLATLGKTMGVKLVDDTRSTSQALRKLVVENLPAGDKLLAFNIPLAARVDPTVKRSTRLLYLLSGSGKCVVVEADADEVYLGDGKYGNTRFVPIEKTTVPCP